MIKVLILYFQFFTAIPIHRSIDNATYRMRRGVIYFPIFALLYGFLLGGVYYVLKFIFPLDLAWSLTLLADIILTRAFHYDALADTADGLLSSKSSQEMLKIMKDPQIGAMGALTLMIILLLLFQSGMANLSTNKFQDYLMVMACFTSARCLVPILFNHLKYVGHQPNGLGALFLDIPSHLIFFSQVLSVLIFFCLGLDFVLSYLILVIWVFFYRWMIYKRIHGMTGDTLGALIPLSYLVFFLIRLMLL